MNPFVKSLVSSTQFNSVSSFGLIFKIGREIFFDVCSWKWRLFVVYLSVVLCSSNSSSTIFTIKINTIIISISLRNLSWYGEFFQFNYLFVCLFVFQIVNFFCLQHHKSVLMYACENGYLDIAQHILKIVFHQIGTLPSSSTTAAEFNIDDQDWVSVFEDLLVD